MSMFNLLPFCEAEAEESGRYSLKSPWIHDGWEYATDSRVCVRQPTTKRPPDDGQRRPDVDTLFENFPECVEKWPVHDGVKAKRPCRKCRGTGRTTCECPVCEDMHKATCPHCVDGQEVAFRLLHIGGRMIAGEYCLKIESLGEVLHGPDGPPGEPLAFICGELQGKVNSLRENTES